MLACGLEAGAVPVRPRPWCDGDRSSPVLTQDRGQQGPERSRALDVENQPLARPQRDEEAVSAKRDLGDVVQFHAHVHLPQVHEPLRGEVEAAPIPEGTLVTG